MANGFVIGTDQSIVIFNQNNPLAPVSLDGKRGMFEMKAKNTLLESDVIDDGGLVDARVVREGYTGTIEVEKATSSLSGLIKILDAAYYDQQPETYFNIVETVRLPDGSIETNTYLDCVLYDYEPGQFQKKQITKPRISVKAKQRV